MIFRKKMVTYWKPAHVVVNDRCKSTLCWTWNWSEWWSSLWLGFTILDQTKYHVENSSCSSSPPSSWNTCWHNANKRPDATFIPHHETSTRVTRAGGFPDHANGDSGDDGDDNDGDGDHDYLAWLSPAQSWSDDGGLAPGSSKHSSLEICNDQNDGNADGDHLVKTGTVTAWRTEECGAPSWTPIRPQPTTVASVPAPSLVMMVMVMLVVMMIMTIKWVPILPIQPLL